MDTRKFWTLSALLLLAAALRLYHLQSQSIWFDEGWSAYAAVQPTLWDAFQSDATNPPLYYVLLNISARFTGDSEFALRWFSLVWGLLLLPLAYQLGRVLFDERAGLYAAFLAAVSPPLWWASQEARMYTLLAVLVCLAALSWHRVAARRTAARQWWLLLWLAELALLYSHNSGPVMVIWLNAVTLLAWLLRRSLRLPDWRVWFAGQVVVGLLWSPYFFARFLAVQDANSSLIRRPELGLDLFSRIVQSFWTGTWSLVGREPLLLVLCALVTLLALALINWRSKNARWLLAHVLILVAGLLFGLSVLGNELHGRYLVMIVPLLLIPLGDGLARLRYPLQRYALSLLFLALLLLNIHFITQDKAYQHDDARAMVQYYADTLDANDTVLAWSYADRYELAFYWDRLGVQAQRVTLPEGTDLDVVLPLLPQNGGDVALNVWYTQRADFRGMMGCVLGNGTINLPEQYDVFGMTNQLYRAPQLTLPALRPFDAQISDFARITAVGGFPRFTSAQALCLPIQLTLEQTLSVDLKAAVRVYNDLGWEVATTDAVFADESQRLTSEALSGATLTAYPLLRLPVGAPPGDYRVEVTLYDEQVSPSGYEVQGGHMLALGTWTAQAGADWSQVTRAPELSTAASALPGGVPIVVPQADSGTPHNGDFVRILLLWHGANVLPALTLAAQDGTWTVPVPPHVSTHDAITLDWRQVQIPLDAASGMAELRLPDGMVIATYTIESLPAQFDAPPFDMPINVSIPNVGTLVGYTIESAAIDHTQPLPITLVWLAENATPIPYTVFVQLLDTSGQVIAQSDSAPAQNSRPTTGWRAGEYISDAHLLQFNEHAAAGTATLIVGMYDPETFERVAIAPGVDALTVAVDLTVR
ncbi:MAG: glycosyltransferase family 39 protein [Anaerolineae bacterium]